MYYKIYENSIAAVIWEKQDNPLFQQIEGKLKGKVDKNYMTGLSGFIEGLVSAQEGIEMRGKAISLSTRIPSLFLVSIWTGGEWINAEDSCIRICHDIFSSDDWKEIPETEYKDEIKEIAQRQSFQMACYKIQRLRDLYSFKKLTGSILRQGEHYYLYTRYSPVLEEFFGAPASINRKLTETIIEDVSILLQEEG